MSVLEASTKHYLNMFIAILFTVDCNKKELKFKYLDKNK